MSSSNIQRNAELKKITLPFTHLYIHQLVFAHYHVYLMTCSLFLPYFLCFILTLILNYCPVQLQWFKWAGGNTDSIVWQKIKVTDGLNSYSRLTLPCVCLCICMSNVCMYVWLIVEAVRAIVLWHKSLFPLKQYKSFLLPVVPSGQRHTAECYLCCVSPKEFGMDKSGMFEFLNESAAYRTLRQPSCVMGVVLLHIFWRTVI